MKRKIAYPAQVPLSADFLNVQRNTLIALAYATQAWNGVSTVADGLTCIPTTPASLAVQITPGSISSLSALDASAYGSLAIDTTHQVMQQGILLDAVNLTLTPPVTAGQAITYLIQAQFAQADTDPTVLAYFNSANPTVPFMGPANSGTSQVTTRDGIVVLQAKAGVAAVAGTQVTPSPDAGYVGLYAVVVANGATTLTSSQISVIPTAPFLNVKLPQVPSYVQGGAYAYSTDAGTANAIIATLSPVPITPPSSIFVKKMNAANTGAMTITLNGLGPYAVINADTSALTSGQMASNFMAHLVWDGTSYRFMNGVAAVGVGSLTASSGEGINVNSGVVALNFPGLTTNASPGNGDLLGYFNQTDAHHRAITWAQFVTALLASNPGSLLRITPFTASGTWVKGANTHNILVIGLGGGGAGASNQNGAGPIVSSSVPVQGNNAAQLYLNGGYNSQNNSQPIATTSFTVVTTKLPSGGGGGGAGGGFMIFQNVVSTASLAVGVGAGGAIISNSQGGQGTLTSIGALATATGGFGGKLYVAVANSNGSYGQGGQGGVGAVANGVVGFAWNGDVGKAGGQLDGGGGGSTLFGGGGPGGDDAPGSPNGVNGGVGSIGAGGGGADATGAGGPGGNGLVLVLEFS